MKLALYLTFPFPDLETFQNYFSILLKHKFDYMELGIPTDHPYYDGPAIRKTHSNAIKHYSDEELKETVNRIGKTGRKSYALVYYNAFRNDESKFLRKLSDMGFSGAIVPDLLTDYFQDRAHLSKEMEINGLDLIPFVNSSTPDKVIQEMSEITHGWIYHGLQPSTGIRVPIDTERIVQRIKDVCPEKEIIFGFGINSIQMIKELRDLDADGIAVGSSLINSIENRNNEEFENTLNQLEEGVYGY